MPVRPGEGTDPPAARPSGCAAAGRAGDPHARRLCGAAPGRQAGCGRHGRGAGLRRVGHGGRSARAAAAGLRSTARHLRAGVRRGARGPAARRPRQRADRGRECGRRARVGDRSLAQRDPARADHRRGGGRAPHRATSRLRARSLLTAPLRRSRAPRWRDEDRRERHRARGVRPDSRSPSWSASSARAARTVAAWPSRSRRRWCRTASGRASSCQRASASRCSARSKGDEGGGRRQFVVGDRGPPLELAPDRRHRWLSQSRRHGTCDRRGRRRDRHGRAAARGRGRTRVAGRDAGARRGSSCCRTPPAATPPTMPC